MNHVLEIIRGICLIVSLGLIAGAVLIRWYQQANEDLGWFISKLVISLLAFWILLKGLSSGPYVIIFAVISGGILSILWTGSICRAVAKPIGDFYDGGNEPPDPKPFYSVARALAARGKNSESVAEIQRQLAKFPGDFEGQMLLAETQAKNLNDLPAAETTIQNLCEQSDVTPQQVSAALTTLADWHLRLVRNHIAAKNCLNQIIGLLPETEFSAAAAHRISHIGDGEMWRPPADQQKYPVPEGVKNFGLASERGLVKPREVSLEELAAQYVRQLDEHPLDAEAREKLAELYATHYERLDLASAQLEQLISHPNQPSKQIVRWLNLLADLQVRCAQDFEAAKMSLEQIIQRFPSSVAAEVAHQRIEHLRLELKGKEKSRAVKLGSYEQNIGLKYGVPRRN